MVQKTAVEIWNFSDPVNQAFGVKTEAEQHHQQLHQDPEIEIKSLGIVFKRQANLSKLLKKNGEKETLKKSTGGKILGLRCQKLK